jgi:hypothetical protein
MTSGPLFAVTRTAAVAAGLASAPQTDWMIKAPSSTRVIA